MASASATPPRADTGALPASALENVLKAVRASAGTAVCKSPFMALLRASGAKETELMLFASAASQIQTTDPGFDVGNALEAATKAIPNSDAHKDADVAYAQAKFDSAPESTAKAAAFVAFCKAIIEAERAPSTETALASPAVGTEEPTTTSGAAPPADSALECPVSESGDLLADITEGLMSSSSVDTVSTSVTVLDDASKDTAVTDVVDPSCTTEDTAVLPSPTAADAVEKDTAASGAGAQPTSEATKLYKKHSLWKFFTDIDATYGNDKAQPREFHDWYTAVCDCCVNGDEQTLRALMPLGAPATGVPVTPVLAHYRELGHDTDFFGTFLPVHAPHRRRHVQDFMKRAAVNGRVDVLKYLSKACAPEDIDQFWSDVTTHAIEHNRCCDVLVDDYITKQFSHTDKHTYMAQYDPARVCKMHASTEFPSWCPLEVKGADAVFVALAGKGHKMGIREMSGDTYPFAVAMTEAAANGHLNVVKRLKTRSQDENGMAAALVAAARHGRTKIVAYILSKAGIYCTSKGSGVNTSVLECALSWAACGGYQETAYDLLLALKDVYSTAGKNRLQLLHHCVWARLCAMNAWPLMKSIHGQLNGLSVTKLTVQNMPADIRAKVIDGFRACLQYGSPSADALLMMMQDMGVTYEDVFADGWTVSYWGMTLWKTIMKTWAPGEFAPLRALLEKVLEERWEWAVDTRLYIKNGDGLPDEYCSPEVQTAYDSLLRALEKQVDGCYWRAPAEDVAEEPGAAQ